MRRQRPQAHGDDQASAAHAQGQRPPRHRLRHPALLLPAGLLRLRSLAERGGRVDAERHRLRAEYWTRLRRAAHVCLVRQIDSIARRFVLAVLLVLIAGSVASAHDERFSASRVEIKPNEGVWTAEV